MDIKNGHKLWIIIVSTSIAGTLLATTGRPWSEEKAAPPPPAPAKKTQNQLFQTTELTEQAKRYLGIPYKFGGNTPKSGLDCSAFVRLVYKKARGTQLPRTSAEIGHVSKPIHINKMQPGDLVFYNTRNRKFSHVGIYMGNKKFIHAPSTGRKIRIESMMINYWMTRFDGARRVISNLAKK